jgi:hypothetical protein
MRKDRMALLRVLRHPALGAILIEALALPFDALVLLAKDECLLK